MSEREQLIKMRLEILGNVTNVTKDEIFKSKLDDAEIVALDTLFPFDNSIQELPDEKRIKNWQVRCAIELYKKIGTTNVASYSENGLSVSYLTSLISDSLMKELIPKVGVPK